MKYIFYLMIHTFQKVFIEQDFDLSQDSQQDISFWQIIVKTILLLNQTESLINEKLNKHVTRTKNCVFNFSWREFKSALALYFFYVTWVTIYFEWYEILIISLQIYLNLLSINWCDHDNKWFDHENVILIIQDSLEAWWMFYCSYATAYRWTEWTSQFNWYGHEKISKHGP